MRDLPAENAGNLGMRVHELDQLCEPVLAGRYCILREKSDQFPRALHMARFRVLPMLEVACGNRRKDDA
jgi:hypothetical protein